MAGDVGPMARRNSPPMEGPDHPNALMPTRREEGFKDQRALVVSNTVAGGNGSTALDMRSRQLMPARAARGGGGGVGGGGAGRKGGGGTSGPQAEVLRLMADHVAEHKRRLEKVEKFNEAMVPTRGWKWYHTFWLLVYTVVVAALATSIGGLFVSSLYGARPAEGYDGIALGGGVTGTEPAVIVVADAESSHVHIRASPANSATLLVGDDGGVLVGGDCSHVQVLDRDDFTPASICSNDGVLTLTGAGGGFTTGDASGRRLQFGATEEDAEGRFETEGEGWAGSWPTSSGAGGVVGHKRVLQESPTKPALRVDGMVEVAAGLKVLAEPLEVTGMLHVVPAERNVDIGSSNRNLPPATLNVFGSMYSNRLTVDGSTFLQGPLKITRGNLEVERLGTFGTMNVDGATTLRGGTTIGDGEPNQDRLTVVAETVVTGVTNLRSDVVIGVERASRRTLQADEPDQAPRPTVSIYSESTFHNNVTLEYDIAVAGDFSSPVFNTHTGRRRFQLPPIPPPWTPDFLYFPCGWDEPVTICMNASVLLAPGPFNFTNLTESLLDIGTDPLCEDDLNGTLASFGYDCETAAEVVNCDFDMSTNAPQLESGTYVRDLCPVTCINCPCRLPWCVNPEEQARRAAEAALARARNSTVNETRVKEQLYISLANELGALHGIDSSRIRILDFQNNSLTDVKVDYRIVPEPYDTTAEIPTDLLAELRTRNTSEFELMVCASTLLHSSTADNRTNFTMADNVTAINNGTVFAANLTNVTLPQLDSLLNSSLLNISNQTVIQWVNVSSLANFSEPGNCTIAVPYTAIYPPPAPPTEVFEWRTVTDVGITGDTSFTQSLTALAEVTLGGPPGMPCRKDGIDYQCVVDIVAPAELTMSLTVSGHTELTSATAEEIDTGLINWESGTAGSLIVGGTISDIPTYYAHTPFMSVGGAMLLGHTRIGSRAHHRHAITGSVLLSGELSAQGDVVIGVSGAAYTTDIYSKTRIYDSLSVFGDISLADTTCLSLVVRGYTLVQGPTELQGDVVLNANSQNTLTVKGETTFQQPVGLREDLTVRGNTVLGLNMDNNVIVFGVTKLQGGLSAVGDINLGNEPENFTYFYNPPPPPPPELVVEYGFRTCVAEAGGIGYDCSRCDTRTNAWQVLDVTLATCETAVNPACAAQANQLLCENNVASGACTWTSAHGCLTTEIPECASANTDVASCISAGDCTFTPATSDTNVVVSLSGCVDAAVVPVPASCTGNSTYIPDSCDATDPNADQATQESCAAADNVLDCFLLGAATCTFTPWSQPNCEVAFQLADDNLAHSCPLGCDFVPEVVAPLPDVTFVPDRVIVSVPTDGMGQPGYTADVWLRERGRCRETALTGARGSVPEDRLACDSVTALADSTACDQVKLNADGVTSACTYSTLISQPSSIAVDLATMPGFRRRNIPIYGFITDATVIPPPPPLEQKVHMKTTITEDLNVYGSTYMQNLSATNVYFPLGARIGTPGGPQEIVELFADTTVIGTFFVDNDVDLAANGNSRVAIGSNTRISADFTATGTVDLGISTLDQAHVEGDAQVDGASVLNGHVTLGSDVFDLTTVKSRAVLEQDVHFTGDDFTVDHSTQLGLTQDDDLLVNASTKLYAGLTAHGQVDIHPLSTCTAHVPGSGLVPFECEQPADGDTECPTNIDYCLFTLGGRCGAPFASMHLTESDCTSAGGTWTWDTQGSCALSDQTACDTTVDAYAQPVDDDGGAACRALKCAFWSSDVVIQPPTTLSSSLAVDGAVTLGTAELTDDWGVTITAATETVIMGTAMVHDTLTLKDATVAESDITVIDGACRYNCIQEVKIDAQHGGLSATGDVVVGGILNPDTELTVGSQMRVNIIREHASNTGVTVEGITFIDGGFERATTDTLEEFTLNHGVDIEGVLLRDGVVMIESQLPGMSSKGELDMLTLTNSGNSDDMDGTLSSILFRQFYYDPSIMPSSDPAMDAINAKESGKVVVGTESDWTQVMTTRDSFMSFHVAENGVVYERVRVNSNGDVTLPGTDGSSNIVLGAETGDVDMTGNVNLVGTGAGQTGIFFQDRFGIDLLDDGVTLKVSSDQDNGVVLWDMGVTGVVDIIAKKVAFDLAEEFHLQSDLRIGGVTRFNDDPEAFSLQQQSADLFLTSGGTCSDAARLQKAECDSVAGTWTAVGALHADVRSSFFYGDVVLQSDPTEFPASLGLSDGAEAFQLTKDVGDGQLKWKFAADVTAAAPAYIDLAVMDSTGTFTLETGSFFVGDVFGVDVLNVETSARGLINIKSADAVNTATVLLSSAAIPELIVSTDANDGTIILNPGGASGFFQVRDVFTVRGSDGTTEIAGDLQVGGVAAVGAASVVTISSGDAAEKSEVVLSDGTDSFSITKLNRNTKPYLSIVSSKVNGVIELAPGETSGELRVNYDRLVVEAATGDATLRGDLTVGGVASGYCATDLIESRVMDCIFPFVYAGSTINACDIIDGNGVELYCATRVDETGEATSLGSACQPCAEGARRLTVTSGDGQAGITVQGVSGGDPYGQLQLGNVHSLTSNLHTLSISASTTAGSVEITPGSAGEFKVFGDKFRVSGPDADVVGHGSWSVGELAENGAASLSVISPDAAATFTVNAAAAGQAATAVFSSAAAHTLTVSQTDGSAAVTGTGSVELSSTGGILISSDAGVSSALIFDASASATGGALVTTANKATMGMAGADFQLAVQNGDILLSGESLAMSVDKFTVDGASGDTFVAGLLTVGRTGSVGGSASAVMDFATSANTFTFATVNDLVVTSSTDDAHVWVKPGTTSGHFKVGDNFLVEGASGNTEISGELTVGAAAGDHVMTDLSVAGTSVLAIAASTGAGTSTLRMGKTGSSTFEITQTDSLMTIASTDNAGTLQMTAAALGITIPTGNSLAVNTDQFTLTDGAGSFSGDVSIGIPSMTGARQLQVSSAGNSATVRVASAAGSDAKVLLTTADGSSDGSQLVQNGAALTLSALDTDGTITLAPGSDASAALYVTSDTKVEEGTNKIHLGVSSAVAGAVLTLSDATGSESTVTQLSDTLTLSSVDGSAGTVNLEAGTAVRVNTDHVVVFSASKEVQTAGDVTVGGTAAATGAGSRSLTVTSADDEVKLLLKPDDASNDASLVFGSNSVDTWTVSKVGTVLQVFAGGTSTDIDFVPDGVLSVGGSSTFSVAAATGNIATAGDATIGCATCSGNRRVAVASQDEHVYLDLTPHTTSKDATLSLGSSGNRFEIRQTSHTLRLTAASADSTLELLPGANKGQTLTVGESVFVITVTTGDTALRGDLTIGGLQPSDTGAKSVSVLSYDDDVTQTMTSGVGGTVSLVLGERSSTDTFTLERVGTTLSLLSGATSGTLKLNPGTGGSMELGFQSDGTTPVLLLDLTTPLLTMRGDLTVGGASATGDRALLVSSSDGSVAMTADGVTGATFSLTSSGTGADTAVTYAAADAASLALRADGTGSSALAVSSVGGTAALSITPGDLNSAGTLSLGTSTEGIVMTALGTTVTLAHQHTTGVVEIDVGTTGAGKLDVASGLLTVNPAGTTGAGGSSLGVVATSGDLEVGGSLTLNSLALPTGAATGTTGIILNKPTGKVSHPSSSLGRISDETILTVPAETITLTNSLVTANSVVVASVIVQCNIDTVVLISEITTSAGQVVFTMSNAGIADCANEVYTLSFAVLS